MDLRFYVGKLIDYIFNEVFGELIQNIIWERQDTNQTTEDIIKNSIIEYKRIRTNDYSDDLFLEYKGKNLIGSNNKACKDIGLINRVKIHVAVFTMKNVATEFHSSMIIRPNKLIKFFFILEMI